MASVRARLLLTTLAVSPDAARVVNAVAYGAALGFQLYYLKSLGVNPAKPRISAMRRAGAVTAAVEGGLYDAAFNRFGDDFLAAQEAHRRKRLILDDLIAPKSVPAREPRLLGLRRAIVSAVRRRLPGRAKSEGAEPRTRALTPRSAQALRSSVLGPAPMMSSAYAEPHDYRRLWTPDDRRVEHQLLVGLEELTGAPLAGLTELNLRPFADPETGLLLPWDEAVGSAGVDAVDKAVLEYLMDSRYGDGVLRGAKAFISARHR